MILKPVILPGEFLSSETGAVVMVFTLWSYWGTNETVSVKVLTQGQDHRNLT